MSKRKRPASFGTDKSLEEQFLASLELELEGQDWTVEREFKPAWLGKRAFRFDFRLCFRLDGLHFTECYVECNGGAGARSGHATLMGRTRDHQKAALAAFAGQTLFSFTSPQVKSGEAAEVVAAWLRGHEAPACLTEPPRATREARRAKKASTKAARKPAKKARLKRAA